MTSLFRRRHSKLNAVLPALFGITPIGKLTNGVQVSGTITSSTPQMTGGPNAGQSADMWAFRVTASGTISIQIVGTAGNILCDVYSQGGTVETNNQLSNTTFTVSLTPGVYYAAMWRNLYPRPYTLTASNGTGTLGTV